MISNAKNNILSAEAAAKSITVRTKLFRYIWNLRAQLEHGLPVEKALKAALIELEIMREIQNTRAWAKRQADRAYKKKHWSSRYYDWRVKPK